MSLGRKIVFVLCLIVFVGSAGMLLNYFLTGMREQSSLEDLAKLKTEREDMKTDKGTVIGKYVDLYEANSDIIGWITVDGTKIDYPVMQSSREDPEYYLRRDYRGNYDINGSLFLQADCILGESKNLTIYGHNMNSGAMFGNLDRYASYDYWKAHPRVFFQTPEGMEEYRIAAVLKADVSMFDFQQTSFHSPQELEAYAAQAKALSLFETGVAGAGCETTLTLVTCSYEWKEARNILVAVKAEPER